MSTRKQTKDRVEALRAELRRNRLDGFVVPHADEYQNEYVPAYAQRLAWLTGFTGSAGTAVVLDREAAIFVDGRYTLQARQEVDEGVLAILHVTDSPVADWIASVLRPGQVLGYDPWLHTPREVEKLRTACEQAGAELTACESNPVDAVWLERPSVPIHAIEPHPVQYAGRNSVDKRKAMAGQLTKARLDAAILTAPASIAWLLNIRGHDVLHTPLPLCFAILSNDASLTLFVHPAKLSPAVTAHMGESVRLASPGDFEPALDEMGRQGRRVLCDPACTPARVWDRLAKAGARVVGGEDPCLLPKACKNPVEVQGARQAHLRDGAALCRFLAWLARESPRGAVTELAAADYLAECRRSQPLWKDLSFPTISSAGSNGAIVHYRSTEESNRRLEPGTLYLVDSGGQYLDGTTDVTRTLAIGTPSAEHRDRFTRVLKGHIALTVARFPKGTTGTQLDILARRFLWEIGLDYDHGTGHGVGSYLGVHEGPQRISKAASSVALAPGMILSDEPGYYKAGAYGIRLENLVVVVECAKPLAADRDWLTFDVLTMAPFDRSLIEPALLTAEERQWINGYHARVWEAIGPLVEEEVAAWLKAATAPI